MSIGKFRVIVARSPIEVLDLQSDIEDLLSRTGHADDLTRTPAYFLATVREKKGRPFVVAVYDKFDLAGIAYCVKRCLFGIPVGIVECGDACGDGSILSSQECFDDVVDIAVRTVLRERWTWLAQLGWISSTQSVVERAREQERSGKMRTRALSFDVWSDLWLDQSYELFLARLGSQTRRNMRYYRRRAERAGWDFVSNIESETAWAVIESLYPLQEIGRNRVQLNICQQQLTDVPGVFFSGLRTKEGEWISIIGGWVKGVNFFILLQMNDASYTKESVSTVLRSYLIESAIDAGIHRMKFIGGCEGILKKYCRLRISHLVVQRKSYLSRLSGRVVCWLFPSSKISNLFSKQS
jgi:hypothetical protein